MRAKHTPGPWRIENTRDGGIEVWNQNTFVATVPRIHERHTICDDGANARLIAAAPEMFDILNALVMCGVLDNVPSAKSDVKKLIAKARGES